MGLGICWTFQAKRTIYTKDGREEVVNWDHLVQTHKLQKALWLHIGKLLSVLAFGVERMAFP